MAKNLQISPDHVVAGGELDFLITGALSTGESVNVCVEFKHAHSKDLDHGLSKQLPEYMKKMGCDFGLYCVMYFKGQHFSEPHKYDLRELEMLRRPSNIRVIVLDLSYRKPPSKL